jgi:glutathione S-transferase
MELFAHPFSSYSQKALIAFRENGIPFTYRVLDPGDPATMDAFRSCWPLERFPVLRDGDRTVFEATAIIEYLGVHHPGPVTLVPLDQDRAVEVRMLDRFFDNYVSTPLQTIVFDARRKPEERDPHGVSEARTTLEKAYRWLDATMAHRTWVAGDDFTMADCAAAPALFYADWTHRIDPAFANVIAYRQRLLARPTIAQLVDEARPFRQYFPLGAPERD